MAAAQKISNPFHEDVGGHSAAGENSDEAGTGVVGIVRAKQWATHERKTRPAHRTPALIAELSRLRAGLQEHRAHFAQARDLIKKGNAEHASEEERQDAATIAALLGDIAQETELVSQKHEAAAADPEGPIQISFRAKKRRLRLRLANVTETAAELFNEAGDALFLTVLWAKARDLFFLSAALLAANLLGRLGVVLSERPHVDEGKHAQFWSGAALYLVEPNSGMRAMKKALKDKGEGGMVFDADQGDYVHADKDAVAVAAQNDLVAGRSEVRTALLMACTQDAPEVRCHAIALCCGSQRLLIPVLCARCSSSCSSPSCSGKRGRPSTLRSGWPPRARCCTCSKRATRRG